jgi:Na+(H+)/acetate symporter ActP
VLALVVVDGLLAVAVVGVAKDVQLRLDAPDFLEQAGAAEAEVEVVGLAVLGGRLSSKGGYLPAECE